MRDQIKEAIAKLSANKKPVKIIARDSVSGITAAAICARALQRQNKSFSIEIINALNDSQIPSASSQLICFIDLKSEKLSESTDRTELLTIESDNQENITAAAVTYLIARDLSEENKDLSHLAVVGSAADIAEKTENKTYQEIQTDAEATIKKGLRMYPATRPIDRVLENSCNFYIPAITGSYKGVCELLAEASIGKTESGYKTSAELSEEEIKNLIAAIMRRKVGISETDAEAEYRDNIVLVKWAGSVEDAREIAAIINTCVHLDNTELALAACLGNSALRSEAQKTYVKYRKLIASTLGQIPSMETTQGNQYMIINAESKIPDNIRGAIPSIMAASPLYQKGTVIIVRNELPEEKTKIIARVVGREGRNVQEILQNAVPSSEGEVVGSKWAAECTVTKDDTEQCLQNLKSQLEVELIKV